MWCSGLVVRALDYHATDCPFKTRFGLAISGAPPVHQSVAQKANLSFLWIKINLHWIKSATVSLCENFHPQSCSEIIHLTNSVGGKPFYLTFCLKVTHPVQQRPILRYFHSAVQASEKCWIITYRKSTTNCRLVPKSVNWMTINPE